MMVTKEVFGDKRLLISLFKKGGSNLEAYLPICQYAELTGLKKNTIHRRAERGTVEAFKNKEGRWFVYYCDDAVAYPEGWITIKEFARKHGHCEQTIRSYISKGYIDPSCVRVTRIAPVTAAVVIGRHKITLIKEDAEIKKRKRLNKLVTEIHLRMQEYRPGPEYLTVKEWAEKEHISKPTVYLWVSRDMIPYVKNDHYIYINKKYTKKGAKGVHYLNDDEG